MAKNKDTKKCFAFFVSFTNLRFEKDLYNLDENHKQMKIKIPPNLSIVEMKCFNEIVKPQLEELYSYDYDNVKIENTKVFISKHKFPDDMKKPSIEDIKNILSKIPKEHLKFISSIYFVSYHCRDDNDKEIKGRTLPITYNIIIYPKAQEKINNILIHEIGHVLFDKLLNLKQKIEISQIAFMASISTLGYTKIERYRFVQEYFSGAYEDFLNEKRLVSRNPFLLQFLTKEIF